MRHGCVKEAGVTWHHSDLVPPKLGLGLGLVFGLDINPGSPYINHDDLLELRHLISPIHPSTSPLLLVAYA
jgi:hypothetical protein